MVLAAACGIGGSASYEQSHTAQQIVADASRSTGSATSFHMAVEVTTAEGPAGADFDVEGANVKGKLHSQGVTVRIVHVDPQTFVYGADLAELLAPTSPQASAIVKAKAADRWVLMPSSFWSSTNIPDIIDLKTISNCLKTAAGLSKKGTSTVSGQQVVEIDDQLLGKMYVQAAAPHYFLRVDLQGVDTCVTDQSVTHERFDLTNVGKKVGITAPSDYVDLRTLAGGPP